MKVSMNYKDTQQITRIIKALHAKLLNNRGIIRWWMSVSKWKDESTRGRGVIFWGFTPFIWEYLMKSSPGWGRRVNEWINEWPTWEWFVSNSFHVVGMIYWACSQQNIFLYFLKLLRFMLYHSFYSYTVRSEAEIYGIC